MKSLKDIFVGTLGVVGYILWVILKYLLLFTPILFLDTSFWVTFLLTAATFAATHFVAFPLWIWSFVVVVSEPIDGWSIAYFVLFAIYSITIIIPTAISVIVSIINLIMSIFSHKSHN